MNAIRPLALAAACCLAATLALAASALGVYAVSATSHAPRVGEKWTIAVRGPERARVSLDILFGGAKVAHMSSGTIKRGRYAHTVRWPERAVGYPLTIQATVSGKGPARKLLFKVKVRK